MTPFEIFANNGHLSRPAGPNRPATRPETSMDDVLARQAFTSVNTVERWVRRVFPG